MAGPVINATGSDRIWVWHLEGSRVYRKPYTNISWIFVTGDSYDLDFLAKQLDASSSLMYEWDTRAGIYGPVYGIRIMAYPSAMPDLSAMIMDIGSGRKYTIFNADIDPVLRFMSERNLQFFSLADPLDRDPPVKREFIGGKSCLGVPCSLHVGRRHFDRIDSDALYEAYRAITDNIAIIYDNRDGFFSKILAMMLNSGYRLPRIAAHVGSTYQSYGQSHYSNPRITMEGKICIESGSFSYSETGLEGLMEISRTSGLPIETASGVTTGTAVSAMEESFAISRNLIIPLRKDDHEWEKDMNTLINTDSGGLVLQPEPGIYTDVHEVDFSSMYPSIMVRYNMSPETIGRSGDLIVHGTPYRISMNRQGFLASALKHLLERRLFYKSVRGISETFARRDAALKWMLLTSFGYTGYKNAKFGKIEIHESITAMGRWALAASIRIAGSHGFRPVHGIVDSLWLSGSGDIESTLRDIEAETGIGIVEDGYYRWIVFMPARSGMGALNRYIGLRHDGTMKVRGLHIRRRDMPAVVKKFQSDAIDILRECPTPGHIWNARSRIRKLEARYLSSLDAIPRSDLVVPVHITRHIEDYSVENVQKMILRSAESQGYEINPGSRIGAVVVDHSRGVVDLDGSHRGADREFYRRILRMSFEPVEYIIKACSPPAKSPDLFSFS